MNKLIYILLFLFSTSKIAAQVTLPQLQSLQYNDILFGNALNFNGSNTFGIGQVYVDDSISNFTIEFWVKNTGADGANDRIFSPYGNTGMHIAKSTTHLKLYISDLGGPAGWQTPCTLESNQWIHLAFVKNANAITVFKNAFQVASYTVTAASILPSFFRLGSNLDGVGENGQFTIDEFRIWNSVRPRVEIQKYMYAVVDPNNFTDLKLYYRFDQGEAGGSNPLELGLYNSAIN